MSRPVLEPKTFDDYEALVCFLATWTNWAEEGDYDVVGMGHLLAACLDNLRAFALGEELEEFGDILDADQLAFLARLVQTAQRG